LSYNLKLTPEELIQQAKWSKERSRVDQIMDQLNANWKVRVETMRFKADTAQKRFLALRAEYKRLKSEHTEASRRKLAEIKMELRLAKKEWKSNLYQFRLMIQQAPALASI